MTNEPAFGSAFLLPSAAVAMPLGKKRTRTYYPQQEDGFLQHVAQKWSPLLRQRHAAE
jgi:hypothetical protein